MLKPKLFEKLYVAAMYCKQNSYIQNAWIVFSLFCIGKYKIMSILYFKTMKHGRNNMFIHL